VVRLEGGQVRLGIDAPRHIPVVRAELSRRCDSHQVPRRAPALIRNEPGDDGFKIPRAEPRGIDIPRRVRSR
jgi:hypothetical protein